jgi:hypothetical protein
MNRSYRLIVLSLLVLSLFLVAVKPVSAFVLDVAREWVDPVVTLPVGNVTANALVLKQDLLPGTTALDTGQFVPVGFKLGQEQYGGSGVKVGGLLDGQTSSICFSFPLYAFDWSGSIHQWNGAKWVRVATVVTPGEEGAPAVACATGLKNGTYSLIIGFFGVVEPPVEELIFLD